MKKIIITLTLLIFTLSCKAQNTTEPRYRASDYGSDNIYYKDLDNNYNTFEGTWLYTNGNTSFKLVLQKKEMMHIQSPFDNYYTDMLAGEYQYIENGVELVNSLANFSQPQDYYTIEGGRIARYGDITCTGCDANNQIAVDASFGEPNCKAAPSAYFYMRYFIENGEEKIHAILGPDSGTTNLGPDGQPLDNCTIYKVPFGEYVFVKQ